MCCTLSVHPRPRKSHRCAPPQNSFLTLLKLRACPIYSLTEAGGPAHCIHGTPLDCLSQMDRGLCSWSIIIGQTEFCPIRTFHRQQTETHHQAASEKGPFNCPATLAWWTDFGSVTHLVARCAPSMCPPLHSPQLPRNATLHLNEAPILATVAPRISPDLLKVSRVYNFGSTGLHLSVYFKAAAWESRFQ